LLTVLLWWIWLASLVFAVACAWRVFRYATAPVHVRWDLYPVAHEPRRDHGGSYFEEKDWWTKPRKKSLWGEVAFMFEEIVFLKGVWANNRKLWYGSLPFHWGLSAGSLCWFPASAIHACVPIPRPWIASTSP